MKEWTHSVNWEINIVLISFIRLLLIYDQQAHTCLMSDHQRVKIIFMSVMNIVYIKKLNTAIILVFFYFYSQFQQISNIYAYVRFLNMVTQFRNDNPPQFTSDNSSAVIQDRTRPHLTNLSRCLENHTGFQSSTCEVLDESRVSRTVSWYVGMIVTSTDQSDFL